MNGITGITELPGGGLIVSRDPIWVVPVNTQHPHKCPVCDGRGTMPPGFYTNGVASGTNREPCKSCQGKGIVWG